MGEFVSVTLVNSAEQDIVINKIDEILNVKGNSISKVANFDESKYAHYIFVQNPQNGWIVITWPRYFVEGNITKALSKVLSTRVSALGIYDGDYWYHDAYDKGELIDSYASIPEYWGDGREKTLQTTNGDSNKLSIYYDISESIIAPYLISTKNIKGKANSGDRFNLNDPWVFTDFMNSIGIKYSEKELTTSVVFEIKNRNLGHP